MDAIELARLAAAEEGADVLAALVELETGNETRFLDLPEAMAAAALLIQFASLCVQIWEARRDHEILVAALLESDEFAKSYLSIKGEKRLSLAARVLSVFLPRLFNQGHHVPQIGKVELVGSVGHEVHGFHGGAPVLVPFADHQWWTLKSPLTWRSAPGDFSREYLVAVPEGFVTDLASIPEYLWPVLKRAGRHGTAAIYHDWLYWEQSLTRLEADQIFDKTMHQLSVDSFSRRLIWAGVRVFGGAAWIDNWREKKQGAKRVLRVIPNDPTITWEEWRLNKAIFI